MFDLNNIKKKGPIKSSEYKDRADDCYTFFNLDKDEFEFRLLSLVPTSCNAPISLKMIYRRFIPDGLSAQEIDTKQSKIRQSFTRMVNKNIGLMSNEEFSKHSYYWESNTTKNKYLNSRGMMTDSVAFIYNLAYEKYRSDIPPKFYKELEGYFKQARARYLKVS